MTSIERRLARFVGNSRVVVPLIWKLFLAQVLTPFRGQRLHFVLDNTPFRDDLTLVYLGLLVHSRVLPVAWAVMACRCRKLLTARGWHYLLRVCAEHTCRRYVHGKLERGWKRFGQIVRHRAAIAGLAKPEFGKKKRWRRGSACYAHEMRNEVVEELIAE